MQCGQSTEAGDVDVRQGGLAGKSAEPTPQDRSREKSLAASSDIGSVRFERVPRNDVAPIILLQLPPEVCW